MDSRSTSSSPAYAFQVEQYQDILQQLTNSARSSERQEEEAPSPETKKPPAPRRLPRFEADGRAGSRESAEDEEEEDFSEKSKAKKQKKNKGASDDQDEKAKKRHKKDDDDDDDDEIDEAGSYVFCFVRIL